MALLQVSRERQFWDRLDYGLPSKQSTAVLQSRLDASRALPVLLGRPLLRQEDGQDQKSDSLNQNDP